MSEEAHPNEGKVVGSDQDHAELAALSAPREIEGSLPDTAGKKFGKISFEDVAEACAAADEQADVREALEGVDSEEE